MAATSADDIVARIKILTAIPSKERSLEQRAELLDLKKRRAQQTAAKLSRQQAALKDVSRKERTRRLIELGGLVAKAELDHLDAATLFGALLAVKNVIAENSAILADWKRHGGSTLTAQSQADSREPLIVSFAAEPTVETRKALKALRLRWSAVMGHWEGIADPNVVNDAVCAQGGKVDVVRKTSQPAPTPAPLPPAAAAAVAPRPAAPVPQHPPGAIPRPGNAQPTPPSPAIRREPA